MKYYNISVNGVAYSVSVEETAAGAAPVGSCCCTRTQRPLRLPPAAAAPAAPACSLLPQALLRSRLRCPATSWT